MVVRGSGAARTTALGRGAAAGGVYMRMLCSLREGKLWPGCSLGRLTCKVCGPRGLPESGVWPQGRCLQPACLHSNLSGAGGGGMPLSPLVLPPNSGAAIWEACAFPPLWGWLYGTRMVQGLWRQQGSGGTTPAMSVVPFLPWLRLTLFLESLCPPCLSQPCD